MAGVLEVVKEAAKEARKLWTVVPASSESPPETRYGESVDDMLAMAAKCLGASLAEVRPIVPGRLASHHGCSASHIPPGSPWRA